MRITYQTDGWDGDKDHIELNWPEGCTTFITISDESITIHSDTLIKVTEPQYVNKLVIEHGA